MEQIEDALDKLSIDELYNIFSLFRKATGYPSMTHVGIVKLTTVMIKVVITAMQEVD